MVACILLLHYILSLYLLLFLQRIGDASQDEMEKEEEQKTIKVQFVRQESDIAKARREASYAFHVQKLEQEAWVPGYYIDIDVSMCFLVCYITGLKGPDIAGYNMHCSNHSKG